MNNRKNSVSLTMLEIPDDGVSSGERALSFAEAVAAGIKLIFSKLLLLVLVMGIGLGVGYFINNYCYRMVEISGSSMVPTLAEGSRHFVNLWTGRMSELRRNDIVVFQDPGDKGMSVKRVIAVPGDAILIKNGVVYLNGDKLNEEYLMSNIRTYTYSKTKEQFITMGVDQYFLLGDNRTVSVDSRSYGPVNRQNILGLVDLKNRDGI